MPSNKVSVLFGFFFFLYVLVGGGGQRETDGGNTDIVDNRDILVRKINRPMVIRAPAIRI